MIHIKELKVSSAGRLQLTHHDLYILLFWILRQIQKVDDNNDQNIRRSLSVFSNCISLLHNTNDRKNNENKNLQVGKRDRKTRSREKENREQRGKLTHKSRPCRVCGHRVPQMLQPRLPPRERVGVVAAGAVDTVDVQVPYFRGVDCDGDLVHLGRSRADRTALRHLRHLRPRGNSRAARRRHTETTGKREKKLVRIIDRMYSRTCV